MVPHTHSADVIEGMVTYVVSTLHNHLEQLRILAYVVTHHKECGFDPVLVQSVQKPWRNLGNGTVIESEIYRVLFRIFPEDAFGIYFA